MKKKINKQTSKEESFSMYGEVLSGSDFAKKLRVKDIVCTIAQLFADIDLGNYSLVTGKAFMRHKYIERAEKFTNVLHNYGLSIIATPTDKELPKT